MIEIALHKGKTYVGPNIPDDIVNSPYTRMMVYSEDKMGPPSSVGAFLESRARRPIPQTKCGHCGRTTGIDGRTDCYSCGAPLF